MIPDLRFVIGAAVSIALLSITALGLGAAVHLLHQTKVGPLEASRLLAFSVNDTRLTGHNDPFARLPASPDGMRPSAEIPTGQAAESVLPAPEAVTVTTSGDPDTVDERAVVDPPLSPDEDPILTAMPPSAEAAPSTATEPSGRATPQAPTEQNRAEPAAQVSPDQAASAASPSPSPSLEPSSAAAAPASAASSATADPAEPTSVFATPTEAASVAPASPEAASVAPATPESAAVVALPDTASAAPTPPETAAVVATPSAVVSDNEPVGSVGVIPANPLIEEPAAALRAQHGSQPKSRKAKAKPKATAALPKPKAKATTPKAKARPRRQVRALPPNASTGYQVAPDSFFGASILRQTGQSRSLWSN